MTLAPDLSHIAAASGSGLQVNPPVPEPVGGVTVGALLALRENTELNLDGTNWQRYRCCDLAPVRGWLDPCGPMYDINGSEHKCTTGCWSRSEFRPFTFYAAEEVNCLTHDLDLDTETREQVARQSTWAVTRELDHAPWSGSPSFRTIGRDITPVNPNGDYLPVSPTQAVAMLIARYSVTAVGGFVLHVPPQAVPFLQERSLLTSRSGAFTTSLGTSVVVGSGYTGVAPLLDHTGTRKTALPSGADPLAGLVTFYATRSMPEYRLGPVTSYQEVFGQDSPTFVHPRTNSELAEAFRTGAARFDAGCVYGIQVSLRDPSCVTPAEAAPMALDIPVTCDCDNDPTCVACTDPGEGGGA